MAGSSSKAQDRSLQEWFNLIEQGKIKLPRFQRHESWDRRRIASFINTIVNNLPVGVTLLLKVGDEEKFASRPIATAPECTDSFSEYLLDGQQRLTALWRTVHNNYDRETYFLHLPEFDPSTDCAGDGAFMDVYCWTRWERKGNRYPLWLNKPARCLEKGLVPMDLFRPGDVALGLDEWIAEATEEKAPTLPDEDSPDTLEQYRAYLAALEKYNQLRTDIKERIVGLRVVIQHFNLPYLALPATTDKEVALQVFINMNTNSKPLSLYDIIVAEVESVKGMSLHDLQDNLLEDHPSVGEYGDIAYLILATSALMQGKLPNQRGMIDMDKRAMVSRWDSMVTGVSRMAGFLESQRIFDRQRLPTGAVLPVLAALFTIIPEDGDELGQADRLLRKYMWSSFFTDRYENAQTS
ncbi:MAG: DUF262 domain-containing protein, partial [Verrucomicrobia bacterium]|nr:DUF262 domain-containing protein [Verrucomicrobiota bacterium]